MRTLRLTLAFSALLFAALSLNGAAETHVVLMHTNDIHGHLLPENGAGGLAIIAAIVKQQHPDMLVDAGDMFTGELVSGNQWERGGKIPIVNMDVSSTDAATVDFE